MGDRTKGFSDLDPEDIDFSLPEWSWGFGYDESTGFIHYTDEAEDGELYTISYSVPKFMVEMITEVRDRALFNLKSKLSNLDCQRSELLKR